MNNKNEIYICQICKKKKNLYEMKMLHDCCDVCFNKDEKNIMKKTIKRMNNKKNKELLKLVKTTPCSYEELEHIYDLSNQDLKQLKKIINYAYEKTIGLHSAYLCVTDFSNKPTTHVQYIKEDESKPSKNYDKIINKIQKVRTENNKCWMNILRLAFKYAPNEAKKIFTNITNNDKKINDLSKELSNEPL